MVSKNVKLCPILIFGELYTQHMQLVALSPAAYSKAYTLVSPLPERKMILVSWS